MLLFEYTMIKPEDYICYKVHFVYTILIWNVLN